MEYYVRSVLVRLIASLLVAFTGTAMAQQRSVGTATLIVGAPELFTANGESRSLVQGMRISVGDVIVTESADHAYLTFDDEALVSVRPLSRLVIDEYEYDAAQPDRSTIKFTLEEGVIRSISGNAAKAARERFRLNTSLAAIGVRGTDFVVDSNPNYTVAAVNEGAIIVSPFSAECDRGGNTACAGNAAELVEGMAQVVEVISTEMVPQLRTIQDSKLFELNLQQYQQDATSSSYLEGAEEVVITDAELLAPEKTVLASKSLAWGRWSGAVDAEDYLVAGSSERPAEIVVMNSNYALLRDAGGFAAHGQQGKQVYFDLFAAQAQLEAKTGEEPVIVGAAELGVDLQTNTFSTELELTTVRGKDYQLAVNGRLDPVTGRFVERDKSQHVAGGLSTGATEAGYFFARETREGRISGLTIWEQRDAASGL